MTRIAAALAMIQGIGINWGTQDGNKMGYDDRRRTVLGEKENHNIYLSLDFC
jgi:hypothetical protein